MEHPFLMFLDHTQRRSTVGRTPLDERSARRRDLYLTTHNTRNRQTSMPPGGIRTHCLSRRAAADLRLRARGHWDRHLFGLVTLNKFIKTARNEQFQNSLSRSSPTHTVREMVRNTKLFKGRQSFSKMNFNIFDSPVLISR